jgi:uncharacterized protein
MPTSRSANRCDVQSHPASRWQRAGSEIIAECEIQGNGTPPLMVKPKRENAMSLPWFIAFVALAAYLSAAIVLYALQDRMLLPATPQSIEIETGRQGDREVQCWSPSGAYAGYVVSPVDRRVAGTFVILHGNGETAEDKLPLATVFVHAGYRAVLAEYPGYGRRAGKRTMLAALTASRDALSEVHSQWPGPIYMVGESLGAGMAAQAASGAPKALAGLLLITPWDSLASVASEKFRLFPVRWMLHHTFDSVEALKDYTGPLVVVGAEDDSLIPISHAKHLVRSRAQAQLLLLPGTGHNDWFNAMAAGHWRQILRWLHVEQADRE